MRGAGKLTHFEYEIRITLAEDKWIIMRRYSRFRELHISMKAVYGEKVLFHTYYIYFTSNLNITMLILENSAMHCKSPITSWK